MTAMTHTITTRRIARAEWTKLRTLPSTWRAAVITVAMAIGFGVAVAYSQMSQWHTMTAQQRLLFDPVSASMTGVMIAAVVLGALAVKTVTAEYSHRDDPGHVHRHARPAARPGGQGRHGGRVRVPGDPAL